VTDQPSAINNRQGFTSYACFVIYDALFGSKEAALAGLNYGDAKSPNAVGDWRFFSFICVESRAFIFVYSSTKSRIVPLILLLVCLLHAHPSYRVSLHSRLFERDNTHGTSVLAFS
jgi:hypothetical protein